METINRTAFSPHRGAVSPLGCLVAPATGDAAILHRRRLSLSVMHSGITP
jgi:hypothetical protein